jgi:hypothetical protein
MSDTTGERITGTGQWRLSSFAAGRLSSTGILKGGSQPAGGAKE